MNRAPIKDVERIVLLGNLEFLAKSPKIAHTEEDRALVEKLWDATKSATNAKLVKIGWTYSEYQDWVSDSTNCSERDRVMNEVLDELGINSHAL